MFPDGELHEVGRVVSITQAAGCEVRHVEALREHYGLTLRHWVDNLEGAWDQVVEEVGDLWALERSGAIGGQYHVTGGTLSALEGVGPDDLNIAGLVERVADATLAKGEPVIIVEDVDKFFGDFQALSSINMRVGAREVVKERLPWRVTGERVERHTSI